MIEKNAIKEMVAAEAVDALVKSGMKLGLGTGSTAIPAVRRIGELLAEGKIKNILAVPTSFQTSLECEKLGIPLLTRAFTASAATSSLTDFFSIMQMTSP